MSPLLFDAFLRTLEQGTKRIEQALVESKGVLPGDKAFELFDTYGFPIDLTASARGPQADIPLPWPQIVQFAVAPGTPGMQ